MDKERFSVWMLQKAQIREGMEKFKFKSLRDVLKMKLRFKLPGQKLTEGDRNYVYGI